ncbi:MAG: phosphate/phosphite/phosphonate ABC transporter substrate-binding protein [Alteromonadaceae bacterium]|jgi:phosphonate transport system substrate-binding protein|nr:phosphate/phosphite/phosphonate ABC transporter substrate-binding protein [Alteromonadaceae bacterium]
MNVFKGHLLVALLIWPLLVYPQPEPLKFGIVPQQSSSRLAEQWTPLMSYLSEQLGRPVRFLTAPDIPTFEQRVLAGQYDIAYMNPYHYVEFSKVPGYRAIAREQGKQIRGIVVVRENDTATQLSDLEGETLAFPAPAAFAATILVRAELERLGVSYTPKYVSSHDSVYLSVARGFVKAGGGIERTFSSALESGLEGARVLWRSPGYTPHAFAVHPDLSEGDKEKIADLLVSLSETEEGQGLLGGVTLKALVSASDSDWDDVRRLGLDFIEAEATP